MKALTIAITLLAAAGAHAQDARPTESQIDRTSIYAGAPLKADANDVKRAAGSTSNTTASKAAPQSPSAKPSFKQASLVTSSRVASGSSYQIEF
jgi:hypothetical protein